MASLNDFKLINKRSEICLENAIGKERFYKLSDTDKKRFGFYYLILGLTTGVADADEIERMIIDTDYCNKVRKTKNNDFGIDAVYINDEENKILLYNFKFRDNFSPVKGGKISPILDSTKFLSMTFNNSFENVDDNSIISKNVMKSINEKIHSDSAWNIELIVVSNESNGTDVNKPEIDSLMKDYDVSIKSISLDDITGFLRDKNCEISSTFVINKESFLVYESDSSSSSKSYLAKIDIADLIRITCSDENLRNSHDFYDHNSDLERIKDMKLAVGVLYENVRGYLGHSKYNKNIINTLRNIPDKFFMFNNGITITAKNVKVDSINAKTKYIFTLEDMQIVNGGQTLRSIYEFKDSEFKEENLKEASVLVRIFKTEDKEDLINQIAEYTNSQNAISDVDLKSINKVQIDIEKLLEENRIGYIRKTGDIGKSNNFERQISKEKLAQIIYSYKGYPDRATNQKKKLFGIYYDEIFAENKSLFDDLVNLINLYYRIEEKYKELYDENDVYNQKILYIIYLQSKGEDDIEGNIHLLEKVLDEYRANDDISKARKLIQKGFKEYLDVEMCKKNE